jgi:hypothetical protein
MPTAPNLPTTVTGGSTGHLGHTGTVHAVVNSIYLASIGTTRTAAYTLTQANSGEVIPVNSASAVAITVPALDAGSVVELVRLGAGAVTLTASGTTFVVPTGATATPRVTGSVLSLLWLTTTSVLVGGDLT